MIGFCVPLLIRVCRGPIVVFLAALPLLLVQCASDGDEGASGATPEARPAVVPEDADPGGWHVEGEPRVFEGDDLFDYINGGAEIYHEYGFRKVTIQEYMGKADRGITLEIFEMTDERSAFGIYTLKTGADGESVAVGGGGLIESYYMNFWKGSRLVTLTGFDDHPETVEGLKSIAMAVEEVIGGVKNRPPLVEALRIGGMIEQSVKYIFGPLGLFNACPQVSGKIFGFTEAAAADFKAGYKVVLFRYAEAADCAARFKSLQDRFASHPGCSRFHTGDRSFSVLDQEGRPVHGRLLANCILLVAGAATGEAADQALDALERRVAELVK